WQAKPPDSHYITITIRGGGQLTAKGNYVLVTSPQLTWRDLPIPVAPTTLGPFSRDDRVSVQIREKVFMGLGRRDVSQKTPLPIKQLGFEQSSDLPIGVLPDYQQELGNHLTLSLE